MKNFILIVASLATAASAQTSPTPHEVRQRMEEMNEKAVEQTRAREAAELISLREENARLTTAIRVAQTKIASLEAEILKLKSAQTTTQPAAPAPAVVVAKAEAAISASEIVEIYAGNELNGDAKFKGRTILIEGIVDRVATDLFGTPFVTIGSGKQMEIRQVQAMFKDGDAPKLATLKPGQAITIRGKVDGLMMNVVVRGCEIVPGGG